MRIHLGCDIGPDLINPLLLQLREALRRQSDVTTVTAGRQAVWEVPTDADVLHLHWPEALIEDWRAPTDADVRALEDALRMWRRTAAVVATVHNEAPHHRDTPTYQALFRAVYRHVDLFIHMGETSVRRLYARHRACAAQARHAVVPHGDYTFFRNDTTRAASRRRLGYRPREEAVAVAFGALRHADEFELLLHGFWRWAHPAKRLLVAGGVPPLSRARWRYYRLWGPAMLDPRIRFVPGFIPHDSVQYYLCAADVLVVPRLAAALNSGNVALGHTFGRVVVGPQTGVIGEELRQTGNPTFDPRFPETLGRALGEGAWLARAGHGAANADHARVHRNWTRIGQLHAEVFACALHARRGGVPPLATAPPPPAAASPSPAASPPDATHA
jgi:glycosyltransferase involved in cell wall biosynthesis